MFAYSTCVTEKCIDGKIEQEANMTECLEVVILIILVVANIA